MPDNPPVHLRGAAPRWPDAALRAYGGLLVAALTWPFLMPGEAFALRDMMVFPDMALTRAALGFGDLAARNVPQDALLGILPWPVLAVRVVMVGAAAVAAWAGYRLGRGAWGKAAAMTVAVWNPFVVERLLQGHWSVVAAAWLLPAVALAWSRVHDAPAHALPGAVFTQWLASLTPTGALAAAVFSRGWRGLLISALTCAPWAIAGIVAATSSPTAASAAAFAPRAETHVGTLGALMGLGGIWNGQAVPASRGVGFALFGVAFFIVIAFGWRAVPRRWLVLAGCGYAVALLSWAGWLTPIITSVPGGGLLRDAQKWLILTFPAFVTAAGALPARRAAAALMLAILQVPDAPVAVAALAPTTVAVPDVDHRGRDVLFVDRPALVRISAGIAPGGDVIAVDPAPKAMNVVESGALRVDATVIDPPSPRWRAAHAAVDNPHTLRELGVGLVVYPTEGGYAVVNTGAPARGLPPLGVALFALWCVVPLVPMIRRFGDASP